MADKFRVAITRDNLKADGAPLFDEYTLKILSDSRIEWEFLPQLETELTPETAAQYDALCVMLAKVTRRTVSVPDRRLKLNRGRCDRCVRAGADTTGQSAAHARQPCRHTAPCLLY